MNELIIIGLGLFYAYTILIYHIAWNRGFSDCAKIDDRVKEAS